MYRHTYYTYTHIYIHTYLHIFEHICCAVVQHIFIYICTYIVPSDCIDKKKKKTAHKLSPCRHF